MNGDTFTLDARVELLRAELDRLRERYAVSVQRQKRAEEIIGRYLSVLFSVAYSQATARQMDILNIAEELFRGLQQTGGIVLDDSHDAKPEQAVKEEPDETRFNPSVGILFCRTRDGTRCGTRS